jgi:hypothetical protein
MVLDGAMTGAWFLAYVEQVLSPTLRPGDVVIMDNLPAHKGAAVRKAIEATGASLRLLPPYSPDFNPIENAFASSSSAPASSRPSHVSVWPSPPPVPKPISSAGSPSRCSPPDHSPRGQDAPINRILQTANAFPGPIPAAVKKHLDSARLLTADYRNAHAT